MTAAMTFRSKILQGLTLLVSLLVCSNDLASAIGRSNQFRVSVLKEGAWTEVPAYWALCTNTDKHDELWRDWDNSKELRDTMSFAIFEDRFEVPVRIRVEKLDGPFRKCSIRPTPYGIKAHRRGRNAVEFTIPAYGQRKISVEFDSDRYHNLFIIGARPDEDKPDPRDPKVIYYGAGDHNIRNLRLYDGETLYADYGAVLHGTVEVLGSGCSIDGNGILCGRYNPHFGNESYSCAKTLLECNPARTPGFKDLSISNITLVDGPSWNLAVFNAENVTIDNVNAISWSLNGDGIDIVSSRNVKIKDCFLRNYDDCITIKSRFNASPISECCDVEVEGCICWNDYARGIVVGIENGNTAVPSGNVHDIDIHDCIILENSRSLDLSDLRAGFAIGLYASPDHAWRGGTARNMECIRASRILFDNIRSNGRNVAILMYPDMDGTCRLDDVILEDFTIIDNGKREAPAVEIVTNQHSIGTLIVSNMRINGKPVRSIGPDFVVSGSVKPFFGK